MACTVRYLLLIAMFLVSTSALAAHLTYEIDDTGLRIQVDFDNGYSNVNTLKLDKSFVVSFETNEPIVFNQEFWDMPVEKLFVASDDTRKRLITDFAETLVVPEIVSQPKVLKITYTFPKAAKAADPVVGTKAYARMIWGLLIILAVMLGIFWVFKTYFKRQVFTDIPGTGRLLGKVDLDIRKSLYFYELDDKIYIMGITDTSMNLIEKVTDEDEVTRIKSGFAKKTEFVNYMKFFKRNPGIKDEVEISRNSISERLKSLRKR
ncbi:FliO/MopB family protein [Seleniivibrio woodruffii]|uniref:FliO/MopB family protein n=1 Tax=Seleniivibrio woodruffii TaxID=1078050 RepID=UPI0039E6CB61